MSAFDPKQTFPSLIGFYVSPSGLVPVPRPKSAEPGRCVTDLSRGRLWTTPAGIETTLAEYRIDDALLT